MDDPDGVFGIAQWFPGGRHDAAIGPGEGEFLGAYARNSGPVPDYPAVQAAARAAIAAYCARLARSTSRATLWAAVSELETSTLFGGFRIDPHSGAQVNHRTVLVRWTHGTLTHVSARRPRHQPDGPDRLGAVTEPNLPNVGQRWATAINAGQIRDRGEGRRSAPGTHENWS
jgi:hypothetical protein